MWRTPGLRLLPFCNSNDKFSRKLTFFVKRQLLIGQTTILLLTTDQTIVLGRITVTFTWFVECLGLVKCGTETDKKVGLVTDFMCERVATLHSVMRICNWWLFLNVNYKFDIRNVRDSMYMYYILLTLRRLQSPLILIWEWSLQNQQAIEPGPGTDKLYTD